MTNNIVIAGRLTEDAELRYTNSGSAVCNFTLANNRNYKNIEKSTFIDVNIFGPYAEAMHKYLLKGTTLDVTGDSDEIDEIPDQGQIYIDEKEEIYNG